jgi:hypothetical protein
MLRRLGGRFQKKQLLKWSFMNYGVGRVGTKKRTRSEAEGEAKLHEKWYNDGLATTTIQKGPEKILEGL